MSFNVTILGSSSAKPTAGRHPSAQVVNIQEQFYMVDAGEGCQQQLFRRGINPLKIRAVFISHLHGDHLFGLFPMLSTLGLYGRKTSLKIYAPHPFGEILESHLRFFDKDLPYNIEWCEVDTTAHKIIFENRTLEVWSLPLRHRVPTSGYIFKEKTPPLNIEKYKIEKYNLGIAQIAAAKRGEDVKLECGEVIPNSLLTYIPYSPRSYAYISDTIFSPPSSERCRGVDLIYHEATYLHTERKIARERGHSTAHEAAKCALQAEAKRLIIGHFSTRYKDLQPLLDESREIFENSFLAIEGETFTIEKQR